jgi:hypothetical protein
MLLCCCCCCYFCCCSAQGPAAGAAHPRPGGRRGLLLGAAGTAAAAEWRSRRNCCCSMAELVRQLLQNGGAGAAAALEWRVLLVALQQRHTSCRLLPCAPGAAMHHMRQDRAGLPCPAGWQVCMRGWPTGSGGARVWVVWVQGLGKGSAVTAVAAAGAASMCGHHVPLGCPVTVKAGAPLSGG